MIRFIAVLTLLMGIPALTMAGPWAQELGALKAKIADGERGQVATRLRELFITSPDETVRAHVLTWAPQLLEIFQTQAALNDFERAKTLGATSPVLALELLSRANLTEPDHPKVLQEMTSLYLQLKEQGKARPLVLKMLEEYPLLLPSHLLNLRLLSIGPELEGLKAVVDSDGPFLKVKELAGLIYAAHTLDEGEVQGPQVVLGPRFGDWPELLYLDSRREGASRQELAGQFLQHCGYGAAAPKYPAAICQKVPEVKELIEPQQESERNDKVSR